MSELLKSRDPVENPLSGDKVLIGETQYEVLTREGSALTVESLWHGKRRSTGMALAGWRNKMAGAVVASVANDVARAKR